MVRFRVTLGFRFMVRIRGYGKGAVITVKVRG